MLVSTCDFAYTCDNDGGGDGDNDDDGDDDTLNKSPLNWDFCKMAQQLKGTCCTALNSVSGTHSRRRSDS